MLKAAIKRSEADKVRHRVVPADVVAKVAEQLRDLTDEVQEVLKEEKEEKLVSALLFQCTWPNTLRRCARQRWSSKRART
jgi:hypothetical protein